MRSFYKALFLAPSTLPYAYAALAGTFEDGGSTLISAMMMFLGNDEKVYMLDKAEGNPTPVAGHPAWGSVWDIASRTAIPMDVRTNTFCSSGMHLPNGSYVTFGGNDARGPNGKIGSSPNPDKHTAQWDITYGDFDGRRAMRILNPCKGNDDIGSPQCAWYDEPAVLSMYRNRWYSAAEATGEGNVVIIGGFVSGGYVDRTYPKLDPTFGGSELTYEYYPPRDATPQTFQFLRQTSGLNAYVHTFLMPSGNMFVQSNLSSVLWDHEANVEVPLPPMPKGVVRVYPASGATAMLPLTPANNYTPTILFCGGSDMPDDAWGNWSYPFIDTWNYPASQDCQRITPEPFDKSDPVTYTQDDDMLEGRTMGQFIILPDGNLLVINGGLNGTAGYSDIGTLSSPSPSLMPFGQSLASGPVLTPALYNPNAPPGSRWSRAQLQPAKYPRLYHSSAILLPDASVLIAGSNPNIDYNPSAIYPTTYAAEIFYPPYFSAPVRPVPVGIPSTLSYGGDPFDLVIPASSYSGSANDAADNATVVVTRGGFTTHAMNMGQRHLRLNNTYTVTSDGSITLHVAQLPPNPNLFQPGPAFVFVTVHGIPSNGTYVIVGSGQIEKQPTAPASSLPDSVRLSVDTTASISAPQASATDTNTAGEEASHASSSHMGLIIGAIAGGVALIALVGVMIGVMARRRRGNARRPTVAVPPGIYGVGAPRASESGSFMPLRHGNHSQNWNNSTASFHDKPSDADFQSPSVHQLQYPPYPHNS